MTRLIVVPNGWPFPMVEEPAPVSASSSKPKFQRQRNELTWQESMLRLRELEWPDQVEA